jgi:Arc/MetJ family transcription regulator
LSNRQVNIDDTLLAEAQHVLGTETVDDTVNTALDDAVKTASRRRVDLAALRRFAHATRDLRDPEVMARSWR